MENVDIQSIKSSLRRNIGKKVRLTTKSGTKKAMVRRGTIESIYPSVFTIKLDETKYESTDSNRRVSFSYTDILTKTVELVVYKQAMA